MNIRILDSWLREYLKTEAKPKEIATLLSLSGPSVERLEPFSKDYAYDIEITTNRIDSASVIGIAREAAVILKQHGFKAKFKPLKIAKQVVPNKIRAKLTVEDFSKLSRRILAVVMDEVQPGRSPALVRDRLEQAGIRSQSNLIDITNYVMLEIGHPCHVFDYDKIKTGKLVLRRAQDKENLVTLDGLNHVLNQDDIIIDDGTGRVIDLPGIMGGQNSMVTNSTKRILFFIEMINPSRIRKTSMKHGIRTRAASYNENEPDSQTAELAFKQGISLFTRLAKAKIASQIVDINRVTNKLKLISITLSDFVNYMDTDLNTTKVCEILADLGFKLNSKNKDSLTFTIPAHRQKDINIKQDLIEEVARIYGYNNLDTNLPPFIFHSDSYLRNLTERFDKEQVVKEFLAALGFFELYNYSMISDELNNLFSSKVKPIRMINPMSQDLVCFRQTLLASLTKALQINSFKNNLKLFELANVYFPRPKQLPEEKPMLSLLSTASYFQLKGQLESVFKLGNLSKLITYQAGTKKVYFDPNQSATIYLDNLYLGEIGLLNKTIAFKLGLKTVPVICELDFALLTKYLQFLTSISPTSKQMAVVEDLTYQFDGKNYWQELTILIKKKFKAVAKIELLDQYGEYFTMRIYSYPKNGQSILNLITDYLVKQLSLKIKVLKDDKNK